MKKIFKLQILMKDEQKARTRIVREYSLPYEPTNQEETIFSICGNMYNFLETLQIPIQVSYETFMALGEKVLEYGEDEEESVSFGDEEEYKEQPKETSNIKTTNKIKIEEIMTDEGAYNKFIEEFKSSNESFKKNVFKSFLKDMYEGS